MSVSDTSVIAGALGITGANTGATVSFNILTKAIWANIKAMAKWLVTNPIGWGILVTGAIIGVAKAVDALIVTDEELNQKIIETESKWQELTYTVKESAKSFQNLKSQADDIIPKYAKLAQGVDKYGNNISLTDEEFKEFVSLNNQLGQMFPELITGYDSNGNAILALSGNVDTLTKSLYACVEAQRLSTAQEIADTMPDIVESDNGIVESTKLYKQQIKNKQEALDEWNEFVKHSRDSLYQDGTKIEDRFNSEDVIVLAEALGVRREQIQDLIEYVEDDEYSGHYNFDKVFDSNAIKNAIARFEKQIDNIEKRIDAKWKQLNPVISAWLSTDFLYQDLDTDGQNIISRLIGEVDFKSLGLKTSADIQNYISDNIISPIYDMDSETQKSFFKIFDIQDAFKNGSLSVEDYKKKIKEILSKGNFSEDFKNFFKSAFDFDDPSKLIEETTKNVDKMTISLDYLKRASGGISSLAKAFNEMNEDGYITIDTISSIKEAVGDSISNWDEYEQKLMSVKKGTAEYNQLMSELTYATLENKLGGTQNLATADETNITAILKENGVLNANKVALDMISKAKANVAAESMKNVSMNETVTDSLEEEANTCGLTVSQYKSLIAQEITFNNNSLNVSQKIAALKSLRGEAASTAASLSVLDIDTTKNKLALADEYGIQYRKKEGQVAKRDINGNLVKDKNGNNIMVDDYEYFYNGAWYDSLGNDVLVSMAYDEAMKSFGEYKITTPDYSGNDTATQTKETFNWIETALSRAQRAVTNFGKTVAATWQSWTMRNAALKKQMCAIKNEISLQDQAYSKYKALADSVGLSEGYKTLVREGAINIETIESESIAEAIKLYQEYYEKALAAKDASADLKDELAALAQTKFSNLAQSFADLMSGNDHTISMYEATIELMEKRGYTASASLYDSLKEAESKNQGILKEKYQSLSQALDEAVSSGAVVKYSEQWYQMQNEILAVEEAIIQSNIALAEYDNALRDLEWGAFDKLHEEISEIYEETEFLDKLLSDEKKFNEDGSITKAGQAALGLHVVNYKTHLAQAEEYAQELEHIWEALTNDPYNQTLLDREDELVEKLRESLTAVKDDEQTMIDTVSEGYDTLLALQSS